MHGKIALLNVSLYQADWPAADRAPNVVILHTAPTHGGGWSQVKEKS